MAVERNIKQKINLNHRLKFGFTLSTSTNHKKQLQTSHLRSGPTTQPCLSPKSSVVWKHKQCMNMLQTINHVIYNKIKISSCTSLLKPKSHLYIAC